MLSDACFQFALESLKKYFLIEPKTGFFFSPQLIYQNLLVVYFVASGSTEASLRQILHIPDGISKTVIQQDYVCKGTGMYYHTMIGVMRIRVNPYRCKINNTFWITNSKKLDDETIRLLFTCGHMKSIDFSTRTDNIRNFINNYTNCVTQRYFEEKLDLLPSNSIDSNTDLILVNTIHFKGQFYLDKTKPGDTKIETSYYDKSDQLNAYILEVSYTESNISVYSVFPNHSECGKEDSFDKTENGIIQLIERLTTEEGSRELRKLLDDGMPRQSTKRQFPKFMVELDLRIYELLDTLGVRELTPSGLAYAMHDFTFMSNLKLGDAVHQVRINMTKSGTTATANNALFTFNSFRNVQQPNISMDTCFPFVCLMYDRCKRSILFSGVLLNNDEDTHTSA